jgi:hypothetical protein
MRYLCGQLSTLERKTVEPMILAQIGADPNAIRGMQQFIGQGTWDSTALMIQAQSLVGRWFAEADGVVIVDGSGFPKDGRHSVGVTRQYCGHLGKIANCQEGVFWRWRRHRPGYAFLEERLYVPDEWFSDASRKRWKACGIPETVVFRTEPELGLETLAPPARAGVISALVQPDVIPFRWVTCDENSGVFGWNRILGQVVSGGGALRHTRLVASSCDPTTGLRPPGTTASSSTRQAQRASPPGTVCTDESTACEHMAQTHYQRRQQRSLRVELTFVRVTPVRDQLPGSRCWAIFRRSLGAQHETKFYVSN